MTKNSTAGFDYAYSEELYTIDGFRWSPDSKSIAYWQMDLRKVGTFYMINNTDSIYPKIIAIPFSKVGEPIAEARIGVIKLNTKQTKWMAIDGDPGRNYLTRMEWTPDGSHLIVQQLNRPQNHSNLILCDPATAAAKTIYTESDDAWDRPAGLLGPHRRHRLELARQRQVLSLGQRKGRLAPSL